MNPIRYAKASSESAAIATVTSEESARYIAGGTTVLDLMKVHVEEPALLVDITALPMHAIEATPSGGVRMGALATMADVADSGLVKSGFPVVSQALLASASPQLRNMATIGGNVLQRTRCAYFRDTSQACNKRTPGNGCAAREGENRMHSVIGTSEHCICAHPSDLATSLLTVDALVHTRSAFGERTIPIEGLYVLPGDQPNIETILRRGELIVAVELQPSAHARRSAYLKVRDRASFEFALVSVAVALDIDGGTVREARIGLGSVAPKPWRAFDVETALIGKPANAATYDVAAAIATAGMRGFGQNNYKIPLTRRAVRSALDLAGGMA
jgi:xanthine dehydrogenase YagS FAD-binding subunit